MILLKARFQSSNLPCECIPIVICYEHPLNERIRTLLRLEDLFNKIDFFSTRDTATEHHAALTALFEVLEITSRADIKSDLLQELERQKQILEMLRKNPNVSETALDTVLNNIKITFRAVLMSRINTKFISNTLLDKYNFCKHNHRNKFKAIFQKHKCINNTEVKSAPKYRHGVNG